MKVESCCRADVLILDEPHGQLDVIGGLFVTEAIRRRRAEGKAVLLSTHIMREAKYPCDHIGFLARIIGLDQSMSALPCLRTLGGLLVAAAVF